MLAKKKNITLEIGDRVRLRNREPEGYLVWMTDDEIKKRWVRVWWDGLCGGYDREHTKYVGYVDPAGLLYRSLLRSPPQSIFFRME